MAEVRRFPSQSLEDLHDKVGLDVPGASLNAVHHHQHHMPISVDRDRSAVAERRRLGEGREVVSAW
jgi:hypothetical protein